MEDCDEVGLGYFRHQSELFRKLSHSLVLFSQRFPCVGYSIGNSQKDVISNKPF